MDSRILVIDDCKPIHALVRGLINAPGVDLFSAYTGLSGMGLARRISPSLILLDVDLPDLNGFEVCRALKADPNTRQCPIVFVTASSSKDERICGMQLDAADYIIKPFNVSDLVLRMEAILAKRKSAPAAFELTPHREAVAMRYAA